MVSDTALETDEPLKIEKRGIEHVEESSRYGDPKNQFTIRFSPVIYLAPIFIGGIAIPLGLGIVGSFTAILVGNILGALATAVCAAMGPRRGMPQMVMSRAAFGYHGNYLPAVCAAFVTLGYTTVGTVVGAKALVNLTSLPFVPLAVSLVIVSLVFAVYGYRILHLVGRYTTWLGVLLLFFSTIFVFVHGLGPAATASQAGQEYWVTWLTEFAIVFSYTVSWNIYASDYSRYLPSSTKFSRVFGYAFWGLFIAATWMMTLGALLACVNPAGVIEGFDSILPHSLLILVLGVLTIASLQHNAVNLYSFSMQTQTWNIPLNRISLSILAGVLICLLSIFLGQTGFIGNLSNFLIVLSYFAVPWFAIQLVEFLYEVRTSNASRAPATEFYDRNGIFRGIRWTGMSAFLIAILVSMPFMSSSLYKGPIASAIGGADISYFVAFVVAGVIYACAKPMYEKTGND